MRDYFNGTLDKTLTYATFRESSVFFTVFYSTLVYTNITETPKMSAVDLLTQIGGSLGMFISLSVFTLFELVELAVLAAYALWLGIKKANKIEQQSLKSDF